MGNYEDRNDDRYRESEHYSRHPYYNRYRRDRNDEFERGWEGRRENPSRYDTEWLEGNERSYRPYTGDDFGRGQNFGGSYSPSFEREYGERRTSSARNYGGTYRPPEYGSGVYNYGYGDYPNRGEKSRNPGDRGWFDRASDEVSSWFGDEEAERRRRLDKLYDGKFRGHGPRGYRRSDERIKEDVNDRLTDHGYLDASDIDVGVSECEVTLGGTVANRRDKRLAEDIAESVSGVKNVQNNLRVNETGRSDTTTATPATARAARI